MCSKGFKWHALQVLISLDQLANTLLGGWADETLSSRCHRNARKYWYAKIGQIILDFSFRPFGKDHCYAAFCSELERRQAPPESRG